MIKNFIENQEFNHFEDLAKEWWLQNGKFKILHTITPLRIKYIKKNIKTSFKNNQKRKNYFKNLEILDLGCGGGLVCEPLSRLQAKVTGIDFVNKNIKIAKQHAKKSSLKINYIKQDLSSLNLNQKYDLILLLEVIEHLDNWKNIVSYCLKHLKPGGRIIFSTINRTLFSKFFAIYITEKLLKWVPRNTHTYNKLVKPEELKNFLENKKMKIIDITGLFFNPITQHWSLNKKKTKINYFCTAEKI